MCHSLSQLNTKKSNLQEEKDLQNEAIKTMFKQNPDMSGSGSVQMVKVKEAWAEVPEKETVVMRKKSRERRRLANEQDTDLVSQTLSSKKLSKIEWHFNLETHFFLESDKQQWGGLGGENVDETEELSQRSGSSF